MYIPEFGHTVVINLSITDTLGSHEVSLPMGYPYFRGSFVCFLCSWDHMKYPNWRGILISGLLCILLYVARTRDSVLIRQVSMFLRCLIEVPTVKHLWQLAGSTGYCAKQC